MRFTFSALFSFMKPQNGGLCVDQPVKDVSQRVSAPAGLQAENASKKHTLSTPTHVVSILQITSILFQSCIFGFFPTPGCEKCNLICLLFISLSVSFTSFLLSWRRVLVHMCYLVLQFPLRLLARCLITKYELLNV